MGLRRTRRYTPALSWPAAACLGLALSLSTASAQDRQIQEPKSTGLIVDTPARFQTWRKITLGAYKGVNGYRNALDAAGIKIGDSADEILGRPAFRYAGMKTEVELTLLSAAKLGAIRCRITGSATCRTSSHETFSRPFSAAHVLAHRISAWLARGPAPQPTCSLMKGGTPGSSGLVARTRSTA